MIRLSRWLTSFLLITFTLALVWACGPYFPAWLLSHGDAAMMDPPKTLFRTEVQKARGEAQSKYMNVDAGWNHKAFTGEIALKDLEQALNEQSLSVSKRADILKRHRANRAALIAYGEAFDPEVFDTDPAARQASSALSVKPPKVTEGLPTEFALYFRGAIAFHAQDDDKARAAWLALLKLPEAQRRYRSIWAEFMLGKLDVDDHPDRAVQRFRRVRSLADRGWVDSLGLAASSLGWEARSHLHLNHRPRALELYLDQLQTGEVTSAYTSIRWTLQEIIENHREDLEACARSERIRAVMTAYLASRQRSPWDSAPPDDLAFLKVWADAVAAVEAKGDPLFESLALAVYQRGLYDLSERLLRQAPADGILAAWLRSKLMFRKGHIEEATALLARVVADFPSVEDLEDPVMQDTPVRQSASSPNPLVYRTALSMGSTLPHGELGLLLLHREEFVQSMDILLRAGFWMDAAYVAERVLTVDELKIYVDRHWPPKTPSSQPKAEFPPSAWGLGVSDDGLRYHVRYLLARRLARLHRPQEALDYYPSAWQSHHRSLMRHLETGRNRSKSNIERARALWEAARMTRYQGMELIGTELAPDWTIHDGNYEVGVTLENRQSREFNAVLPPSNAESLRSNASRSIPFNRYHYRFLAADLAWEALQLMPDNANETARVFCEAGGWLKHRDPGTADKFYKALVKRCPQTAIGKAARDARWFPKLDDQGNPVTGSKAP